jgi:hypothetical protein
MTLLPRKTISADCTRNPSFFAFLRSASEILEVVGGLFLVGKFSHWSVLRAALESHKQGSARGYKALEQKVAQGRRRSGGGRKTKEG